MELRDGSMAIPQPAGREPAQWRVTRGRTGLKFAGAAVFVVAGLLFGAGDPTRLGIAGAAAAGLVAFAVRDLVAPVRLAADQEGVTVIVGFVRHRRLPWSQIERVRVDVRQRLGARLELLEIDTGDALHLYSSQELGAPVTEVAERLVVLRGAA